MQLRDHGALLIRQHLGFHLGDAEPAGNGLRGGCVVAGEHHHPHALAEKRIEGICRGGLHGVSDGDHRGNPAVDPEKDRSRAVVAQPFGFGLQLVCLHAALAEKFRVAEHEPMAIDEAHHAFARR